MSVSSPHRERREQSPVHDSASLRPDADFVAFLAAAVKELPEDIQKDVLNDEQRRKKYEEAYKQTVVPLVENGTNLLVSSLTEELGMPDLVPQREQMKRALLEWSGTHARDLTALDALHTQAKQLNDLIALQEKNSAQERVIMNSPEFAEEMRRREADPDQYKKEYAWLEGVYATAEDIHTNGSTLEKTGFRTKKGNIIGFFGDQFRTKAQQAVREILFTPKGQKTSTGELGLGHSPEEPMDSILSKYEIQKKIKALVEDGVEYTHLRKDILNHFVAVTDIHKHIAGAIEHVVARELQGGPDGVSLDHLQKAVDVRKKVLTLHEKKGIAVTVGASAQEDKDVVVHQAMSYQKSQIQDLSARMEKMIALDFREKLKKYHIKKEYQTSGTPDQLINKENRGFLPAYEIPKMLERHAKREKLGTKDRHEILEALASMCERLAHDREVIERDPATLPKDAHKNMGPLMRTYLTEMARLYRAEAELIKPKT